MLALLITSGFLLGTAADTGYIKTGDETLTMKNISCGVIRHKDTGNCVTVSGKGDEPRYLTLTDGCTEDKNIFCYDSESRFVRLQNDTDTDICVTITSNNLVLSQCHQGENMKWVYTEDSLIKKGGLKTCWEFERQLKVSAKCEQEFFFLSKYGDNREQKINMKTDQIVIKMNHKEEQNQGHKYRFHIVLDFFTTNENSSIGQIRVQMTSLSSVKHRITVMDWRNHEGKISTCSIGANEAASQLAKLAAGTAALFLGSDTAGNLRVQLSVDKTSVDTSNKNKINNSKKTAEKGLKDQKQNDTQFNEEKKKSKKEKEDTRSDKDTKSEKDKKNEEDEVEDTKSEKDKKNQEDEDDQEKKDTGSDFKESETSCEAEFLDKADKVVLQWMNLGDKDKNDPDDLFTVTYQLWRKFHLHQLKTQNAFVPKKEPGIWYKGDGEEAEWEDEPVPSFAICQLEDVEAIINGDQHKTTYEMRLGIEGSECIVTLNPSNQSVEINSTSLRNNNEDKIHETCAERNVTVTYDRSGDKGILTMKVLLNDDGDSATCNFIELTEGEPNRTIDMQYLTRREIRLSIEGTRVSNRDPKDYRIMKDEVECAVQGSLFESAKITCGSNTNSNDTQQTFCPGNVVLDPSLM